MLGPGIILYCRSNQWTNNLTSRTCPAQRLIHFAALASGPYLLLVLDYYRLFIALINLFANSIIAIVPLRVMHTGLIRL